MIMLGSNIQSPADPLRKIQVSELYHGLINPKASHAALIRQLRVAYQINPKLYSQLKRSLPYVVCGIFNPPYRRTDNFGYTEYFIIDIDHLSQKDTSVSELKSRLQKDSRVTLCFISPSEDGLKLLFRLRERCYDAGTYTLFYKEFLRRFSQQYQLEQVADMRTSDVARACFLSVDPQAFFNENSESIDINDYINTSDPLSMFDLKSLQDKKEKQLQKESVREETPASDPDQDVMMRIKQRLNPQRKAVSIKPEAFVPQQLTDIIEGLKNYIEETGLIVTDMISIQYGKKIRVKMGLKEAEINIFYGRKGFSVVKSPRCGTNPELNDVCAQLIQGFIDTQ